MRDHEYVHITLHIIVPSLASASPSLTILYTNANCEYYFVLSDYDVYCQMFVLNISIITLYCVF